jgi:response regulator RpfG family c-di-GMP phosphodiesterase
MADPEAITEMEINLDLPPAALSFLGRLLHLQLVPLHAVDQFLDQTASRLADFSSPEQVGQALVEAEILTRYQLDRVLAGSTYGLVLGNHRVLDRLGAGAMGTVFLAEHLLLKRHAAIKTMPVDEDCSDALLERFYAEMRVLADLHHPNIVLAYDAGQLAATSPNMPALLYLVMELVQGGDLEEYIIKNGPVSVAQGCAWIRQAACGLQEAHDRHLVHRDIKPSNLLLSEQNQVKLVDFGLARQFCSRLTDPRNLLGTLEYMAPEQSHDPSGVIATTDIYGLGATLFWLLTGETPYPRVRSVAEAVRQIQSNPPRRLRTLRPDVPTELDDFVDRMLDRDPTRRPALPLTVMNVLLPFTTAARPGLIATPEGQDNSLANRVVSRYEPTTKRVLLVEDEPSVRLVMRSMLEPEGFQCTDAEDTGQALAVLQGQTHDLIILDLNLPDGDGYEICRRVRERPNLRNCKIIVVSGRGDHNQLAASLLQGADDYIPKPFGVTEFMERIRHAFNLKEAQDQAEFLARQLVQTNRQLENSLTAKSNDVRRAQNALLFAMAKMAESKDGETPGHLRRLQRYVVCLAEQAANQPSWAGVVNGAYLEQLEQCVPLHDIGKIGLPESILLKPGKLTDAERALMETHTIIGDRILESLGQEHGQSLGFLGVASAIVRHHHERFNGTGYPDRLAGDAIPAAARLVAIADVYDALRRQRLHKPALTHAEAARIITEGSTGQFDPHLVRAFAIAERDFERIYRDIPT